MHRLKITFAIVASTLISSCGLQVLQVEQGGEVAGLASTVSSGATTILEDAEKRREQAFLSLVASDPSCEATIPLRIFVPTDAAVAPLAPAVAADARRPVAAQAKTGLCANGAQEQRAGFTNEAFDFRPFATKAVQPTIDLITALGVYGSALNTIVSRPKTDVSKEVDRIIALANKASETAATLGISGIPGVPKLGDDQKATAVQLIQFVADLERERRQAKDIKKLYEKHAAEIGTLVLDAQGKIDDARSSGLLLKLAKQITTWSEIVAAGNAQIAVTSLQRAYRAERQTLSFEGRRSFVTLIREATKEPGRVEQASKNFLEAISGLSDANGELGMLLTDPTPEARARAAKITQARIVSAVSLIAKALAAWKVI
jgi:hypothetical protein